MSKYQVILLGEEEYQELTDGNPRYVNARESIGFADPVVGKGYVRATLWPELNRYLVNHEFEHLLHPDDHTHLDENGIYHKKGFLRNFGAIASAPFTGGSSLFVGSEKNRPVVGKPGGGLNDLTNTLYKYGAPVVGGLLAGPAGASLGSAFGNIATGQRAVGKKALTAGALATGAQALSGGGFSPVGGLAKFAPTGPEDATLVTDPSAGTISGAPIAAATAAPTTDSAGGSALNRFGVRALQGSVAPASQTAAQTPASFGQGALTFEAGHRGGGGGGGAGGDGGGILDNLKRIFGGGGNAGGTAETPTGTNGGSRFNLPALGIGAGLLGLSQFGGPKAPEAPDFGSLPNVSRYSQALGKSLTPEGSAARSALLTNIQSGQLSPEITDDIRRTFDRRRAEYSAQFKTYRPNADIASDYQFKEGMTRLDKEEAASLANAREIHTQGLRQDIATGLGVDEGTLQHLAEIAQLDVSQIMLRTGLESSRAQAFKDQFGKLAALFVQGGLGLNFFPMVA